MKDPFSKSKLLAFATAAGAAGSVVVVGKGAGVALGAGAALAVCGAGGASPATMQGTWWLLIVDSLAAWTCPSPG